MKQKIFILIFILIPCLVSIIGGMLGALLVGEEIFLTSDDGIDSVETYIILSGYLSCLIFSYLGIKTIFNEDTSFYIQKTRTFIIAIGLSYLLAYFVGYFSGDFLMNSLYSYYDSDNPLYEHYGSTVVFLTIPQFISWLLGGFIIIHIVLNHYIDFSKFKILETKSIPVEEYIEPEVKKGFKWPSSRFIKGILEDKKLKPFFWTLSLGCIGTGMIILGLENEPDPSYSLIVNAIVTIIFPLFFFFFMTLFLGFVYCIIFTVRKIVSLINPQLSMTHYYTNRIIKSTQKDQQISLLYDEKQLLQLNGDEFLLWFGLYLYSIGLAVYSFLESFLTDTNQLEIILFVVFVVFLVIVPLLIPFLEPQMLLYSSGLFIKNIRTGESKRVGWIYIVSKSRFLKISLVITGIVYIITAIANDVLELLFININQLGMVFLFISSVLFAGWLIYLKYYYKLEEKQIILNNFLKNITTNVIKNSNDLT